MSSIFSVSTWKGSSNTTTKSASLPGVIDPLMASGALLIELAAGQIIWTLFSSSEAHIHDFARVLRYRNQQFLLARTQKERPRSSGSAAELLTIMPVFW
jgi:hypothetical protein